AGIAELLEADDVDPFDAGWLDGGGHDGTPYASGCRDSSHGWRGARGAGAVRIPRPGKTAPGIASRPNCPGRAAAACGSRAPLAGAAAPAWAADRWGRR